MLAPAAVASEAAASTPAADWVARVLEVWVAVSAAVQGSQPVASAVAEVWAASVGLLVALGLLLVINVVSVLSQLVASVLPLAASAGAGSLATEAAFTADGATGTELPG